LPIDICRLNNSKTISERAPKQMVVQDVQLEEIKEPEKKNEPPPPPPSKRAAEG
jgi:hypothetical protein